MIALSIRQPWCHHILYDGKDVENRTWSTKIRGRVLIHAGKKSEDNTFEGPLGGFVGIATIIDCVSEMKSKWFHGPFGFVLEDPVPIEFIPYRGKLGFFTPDITPDQIIRKAVCDA